MSCRLLLFCLFIFIRAEFTVAANFFIPDGDIDSLRSSIEIANINGESDTIHLAPDGLYIVNERYPGDFNLDGAATGFPGLFTENLCAGCPDIVFYGNNAHLQRSETALSFRAFYGGSGARIELHDLNISKFKLPTTNDFDGGAFKGVDMEFLGVYNCNFENNELRTFSNQQNRGGGAFTLWRVSEIMFHKSVFRDNIGNLGGALYITKSKVSIDSCLFIGNVNPGDVVGKEGGGAIRIDISTNPRNSNNVNDVVIRNSIFENNSTFMSGGAIKASVDNNYQFSIEDCIFRNNTSNSSNFSPSGHGGAAHISSETGFLDILRCSFYNNEAEKNGGALYLRKENIDIENSSFAYNHVGLHGGAIYSEDGIKLNHLSIAYNHAGLYGGGIRSANNTQIKNTLLALNTANNEDSIRQNAVAELELSGQMVGNYFVDGGNNLEYPPLENKTDNAYASNSGENFNVDPFLLDTLSFLCGNMPLLTFAANSPAIDKINGSLLKDQRGRPRDSLADIGAFEFVEGEAPYVILEQEGIHFIGLEEPTVFRVEKDQFSQNPNYQWFLNGEKVQEGSQTVYQNTNFSFGDKLYVIMVPEQTESCPFFSPTVSSHLTVNIENADPLIFETPNSEYEFFTNQTELEISASFVISEIDFVKEIQFEYRGISDENWKRRILSKETYEDKVARVMVDPSWLDEIGLEYRFIGSNVSAFEAQTEINHLYREKENFNILSNQNFAFGNEIENYRMISVPYFLGEREISKILEDQLGKYKTISWRRNWRLFHFDKGSYKEYTESDGPTLLEVGKSYFLILDQDPQMLNTGVGFTTGNNFEISQDEPFQIALNEGYNQISSPYPFDVSWEEIRNSNPDFSASLDASIFTWENGSWQETDKLLAGKGNMVNARRNGTISIPVKKAPNKRLSDKRIYNSLDQVNWQVYFELKGENQSFHLGALGMHPNAELGEDEHDILILPKISNLLELTYSNSAFPELRLYKDIVPSSKKYSWEFSVKDQPEGEILSLNWENEYFGNSGMELWLYDQNNQKIIDMSQAKSYSFVASNEGNIFQVHYGSYADIKDLIRPSQFLLGNPYPQPFNGKVSIPVSLPDNSHVYKIELTLFDLMGRQIKTIYKANIEGGFHEIPWNTGILVPATYSIRLSIDGQVINSKKVLITN